MLYFERTKQKIGEEEVTLTSWLDKDRVIWRALAPHYIHIVHEWTGVTGASREEALGRLKAILSKYFAVTHQEESGSGLPSILRRMSS